jgi:PAS domain S-box-containing protein
MKNFERRAASQSEDGRYRLLVEAVTDYAIYMLDPDGIITSWNPGAQRFKGYRSDEIIGQHFSRFYSAEDRAAGVPERALKTALSEGKFEAEGWRVRKDGSKFWAYVIIDPILTTKGEVLGYAKITRDLTERKIAEDALRRSQEQFRLLVQGVTDYAIYLLDLEGRVSSWNAGAERIKGYTPEEIIGEHFSRFYTPDDIATGQPEIALKTARANGRFEKEGWRRRKDGTRFWAHIVIDPIRNDEGELIGFAKITRDITERREAAEKLEAAREALFQSQKLEAIGQLTGGVAHDFNNLLMAIMASLEMLRKIVPDDPRVTRLLDNAMQGTERGATLTRRMLAFARRQSLKLEKIDLPLLIHGMSDLLSRTLGPTIHIEKRFLGHIGLVMADPNQVEMALLNLVVNARDATGEGGGDIIISAREHTVSGGESGWKAGKYVCVSVTDHGGGMDQETIRRAIEPFFTTKGIGKGTGLGLPMVHGLAEQSGGRFVLRSKLGEGTTAEIWMPVCDADDRHQPDMESVAWPTIFTEPRRILVVDDDALVLMSAVVMLEDLGHTVFEAASGKAALQILAQGEAIDLVITDQAMPQMSGLQLAEAIQQRWPDLPVMLATGYAELEGMSEKALPRLTKPFTQRDLAEQLARLAPSERSSVRN